MKISIASYAFHGLLGEGKMDVFGYLESVKYRYGLGAADIWNGMLTSTDEGYLKKIRESMDERELILANLCVDGAHVWEDDPNAREKNYQNALANLRAAEILGAKSIRIDAGGRGDDFTNEMFDHVVMRFKEYSRRAYDNGYKVGPENHWGPERVPANMKKMYEAVDSPAFGLLLHIGGWSSDDPDSADKIASSWAMHTHISWNITETCLEQKMQMLADAKYSGYWSVEHHTGKNEYTEVAIQVAKVQDILDRWRVSKT